MLTELFNGRRPDGGKGGRVWAAGLAAAGLVTFTSIAFSSSPAWAGAGTSVLWAGQTLQAGQELISDGGQYALAMQTDGNLVVYGNGCALWASNTAGTGSSDHLVMQTDGNLVIYTSAGRPVWASNTVGSGSGDYLAMQTDGNLVVYTSANHAVWASGAANANRLCTDASMSAGKYLHSASGQYKLYMQGDGNLVVYTSSGTPVWASNTAGTGSGNSLVMQNDGNLVIYTGSGNPVWASKSSPSGSGTGGYPYASALCEFGSAGGSHCVNPRNASDAYDWGYWSGSTFRPYDQWGYEYRNCTSYVAWRLASTGVKASLFTDLGNADTWIHNVSEKAGVTVNHTASPGAVAVWNSQEFGHVAWVESISGGTVTVSDYNYAGTGVYNKHAISSAPTDYIHFP